MKLKIKALLIFSVLTLTSCSGEFEESSDASISLASTKTYLLPGNSSSCLAKVEGGMAGAAPEKDITGKYFSLKNVTFLWSGTSTFNIAYIEISFDSAFLGSKTVIFTDEEVEAIFEYGSGGAVVYDGTLAPGVPKTPACEFKVGGITVPDQYNQAFEITAKIKIVGTFNDGVDDIPASTTQEFTIINFKQ